MSMTFVLNPSPSPSPRPSAAPPVTPPPATNQNAGGGNAYDALVGGTLLSPESGYGFGASANKVYIGGKSGGVMVGPIINESQRYSGVMTVSDAKKLFYTWSDKQVNAFKSKLSSWGFKNVSNTLAASMWETAVDGASAWYSKSDGKKLVTPEQYIQWYAKGQGLGGGDTGPVVTKDIYLYDKAQVGDLVKKTVSDTLGREATESELTHFYTVIKDMMDEGTVRTTKKVGGVTVSTTTPGFSTEKATAAIESELKTTSSEDYLQKQSLDFADFLGKLDK